MNQGWIRDSPDFNDELAKLPFKSAYLPKYVSLRAKCPPVYTQGPIGSCVAQAVCAAFQFTEMEQRKAPTDLPSRLFLYYQARALRGTTAFDSGSSVRDVLKALQKFGVPRDVDWPYDPAAVSVRPNVAIYDIARVKRVNAYHRVPQKLYDLKMQLYAENPVIFGITLYESFMSDEVRSTGIIPLPVKGEKAVTGHCLLFVGYDDEKSMFLARNSWGPKWGDDGYCWIPYTYVINPGLCQDFWTITKIP